MALQCKGPMSGTCPENLNQLPCIVSEPSNGLDKISVHTIKVNGQSQNDLAVHRSC